MLQRHKIKLRWRPFISQSVVRQWILFTAESFDVTPKTTEQNLTARSGKSEAEVTNNKRLRFNQSINQSEED